MFRIFILIFFIVSSLFSQEENNIQKTFIDIPYKYVSEKVESISNLVDDAALSTLTYAVDISKNQDSVDKLFKNQKYIEDTEKSFLRLSSDYAYNTKINNDINIRLSAKLALSKSKKRFKLYLNNFNQDNFNNVLERNKNNDEKPEIGISYRKNFKKNFTIKYSIGIRNLYPYIRSRISYKYEIKSWIIEPMQKVEYSTKDEFKEETKIYIVSPEKPTKPLNLGLSKHILAIISTNKGSLRA